MQSMCFIASAWKASDDMRKSLVGSSVLESAIVLSAGDGHCDVSRSCREESDSNTLETTHRGT
jgi:hypothetical protein